MLDQSLPHGQDAFQRILIDHAQRYPLMQLQDIYKLAHQAALGSEHAINNIQAARDWLQREVAEMGDGPLETWLDPISADGRIVRVHLRPYLAAGGDLQALLHAFSSSGDIFHGEPDRLRGYLAEAVELALIGALPYPPDEMAGFFERMATQGYPAVHHSEAYETAYKPVYRVVLHSLLSPHTALIGITMHPDNAPDRVELDTLLHGIVRGVERAGGLAVLIPTWTDPGTAARLLARLDGLLLSGGGDIDPTLYGSAWHPGLGGVDAQRDRLELALARQAVEQQLPIFGICRGAQLLNVAMGGSLFRDVGEHPAAQQHTFYPDYAFDFLSHPVRVEAGSLLASTVRAGNLQVNSLHHQALAVLGPGVRATACAPDGIVEAIELPDHPFALAVQWHPEALPDNAAARALFRAFVQACEQHADG